MSIQTTIKIAALEEIQSFRELFLHESNFQFVHDKCHLYGWATNYLFSTINGVRLGYGAVWGQNKRSDRDAIFEFYLLPDWRRHATEIFRQFCEISGALFIGCQSNDRLLTGMMYEFAESINAESILFEDSFEKEIAPKEFIFDKKPQEENIRTYDHPYTLKMNDLVVASGGLMLNYNLPYADIYYEVNEAWRRQGLATLMIQHLKKAAYAMDRLPAARCNIQNTFSKKALLKAGFTICGHILTGKIRKS